MHREPEVRAAPGPGRDRSRATAALLDAAERLLITHGHAAISTRRVAEEAGVNHGLVHYYFGSMEELLMQVLERFTGNLIARQRAMYAAEGPFIEKWRLAWRYHEQDLSAGYPKVWFELQAMAWNDARMRERLQSVNKEWREVLTEAFDGARNEVAVDLPPTDGLVALVMFLAEGAQLERLLEVDAGHASLLGWIEKWMEGVTR